MLTFGFSFWALLGGLCFVVLMVVGWFDLLLLYIGVLVWGVMLRFIWCFVLLFVCIWLFGFLFVCLLLCYFVLVALGLFWVVLLVDFDLVFCCFC